MARSYSDSTLSSVDSMNSFISFEEEHITDHIQKKEEVTLLEIKINKNIVYRIFHLCIHTGPCVYALCRVNVGYSQESAGLRTYHPASGSSLKQAALGGTRNTERRSTCCSGPGSYHSKSCCSCSAVFN